MRGPPAGAAAGLAGGGRAEARSRGRAGRRNGGVARTGSSSTCSAAPSSTAENPVFDLAARVIAASIPLVAGAGGAVRSTPSARVLRGAEGFFGRPSRCRSACANGRRPVAGSSSPAPASAGRGARVRDRRTRAHAARPGRRCDQPAARRPGPRRQPCFRARRRTGRSGLLDGPEHAADGARSKAGARSPCR